MASTEAQKRASIKYTAANVWHLNVALNKGTDADIIARLQGMGNKQGYIKRLIREDMAREAARQPEA